MEARAAAAKILAAVVDRKTPLDGMLDAEHGNPAYIALNEADRGLVRAIVQTGLRYRLRIEAILSSLLQSPLPQGARSLHELMVVGAVQILYLDVPDHSAVDIAVELANRDPRSRRFAKLVNAILRRVGREKEDLLEQAAGINCIPQWFFARLVEIYGEEDARAISEAQLHPAAIDLTVKGDPAVWAAKLEGRVLPTGSVRLPAFRGAIPLIEGFEAGDWWVQDAAATIPAKLFGDISDKRVADLCAAPGGKTAQLVMAGAAVTAVEQSPNRLDRLRSNLARLGFEADCIKTNLMDYEPDGLFDAVLLDAPCSSTGTTRRHPDVLWTKSTADIEKLAGVQERLLLKAADLVNSGGTLVFSNCSLDPKEGEDVVARVLDQRADLQRVAIHKEDWPGLEEAITSLGEFRTTPAMLPSDDHLSSGMDGFYACVIRKN